MTFLFNLIVFVLLLSVIVIVHEFGHFITAKKFGVYCSEFSIGMGPVLYQRKFGETAFSIRLLPIGGYVAMAGEEGNDIVDVPYERTINGIKAWKQIVVMAAGAFMNVVLAWVLFVGVVMARGTVAGPYLPVVSTVIEKSPAATVGLQVGDEIVKVTLNDGTTFVPETFDEIVEKTQKDPSARVIYTIKRGEAVSDYVITPVLNEETGAYQIGIGASPSIIELKWYEAFKYGTQDMIGMGASIFDALKNLVRGIGLQDMSGPVGIFQATSQITQSGFSTLMRWMGFLSLNVGIFNLMPLPILDGGRILIVALERLIGKKMSERMQTIVMMAGAILVFGLMIYVTFNDIFRLFR